MKKLIKITLLTVYLIPLIGTAQDCPYGTSAEVLHGNAVKTLMLNGGDLWWDTEGEARYHVPDTNDAIERNVIFAGATWVGGIDDGGQLRLAAQTYRQAGQDFWPGPLDENGTATTEQCQDFDTHYKVKKEAIENHQSLAQQYDVTGGGTIPISEIHGSIRNWPAAGNEYFTGATGAPLPIDQGRQMAPFVNYDGEPGYDPTKGDHPDIRGSEEGIFWVINDKLHMHTSSGPNFSNQDTVYEGGQPLGMEIRKMAYAYNQPGALDSTTFYHFEYEARERSLDSVYVAMYVDVDVGNAFDDFVGCDTTRDLAIGYNGDAIDEGATGYGENPPLVGIDFLNVDAPRGQPDRGMSTFMYYNNDFSIKGNPEIPSEFYGYMQGLWRDSSYPVFPAGHANAGSRTNYMYYSDPDEMAPGAWSECKEGNTPFDRRLLISSGPYSLEKGETLTLDFAAVYANCTDVEYDPCPSFDCIQSASDEVQDFFDNNVMTLVHTVENNPTGWDIYPNPVTDVVRLQFEDPFSGDVHIYDPLGREVMTTRIEQKQQEALEVDHLTAGVYLVELNGPDGSSTRQLVVQE